MTRNGLRAWTVALGVATVGLASGCRLEGSAFQQQLSSTNQGSSGGIDTSVAPHATPTVPVPTPAVASPTPSPTGSASGGWGGTATGFAVKDASGNSLTVRPVLAWFTQKMAAFANMPATAAYTRALSEAAMTQSQPCPSPTPSSSPSPAPVCTNGDLTVLVSTCTDKTGSCAYYTPIGSTFPQTYDLSQPPNATTFITPHPVLGLTVVYCANGVSTTYSMDSGNFSTTPPTYNRGGTLVLSHFDSTVGSGKVSMQLTNAKLKSSAGAFITVSGTWTGIDLIGDSPACH